MHPPRGVTSGQYLDDNAEKTQPRHDMAHTINVACRRHNVNRSVNRFTRNLRKIYANKSLHHKELSAKNAPA